MGRQEPDHLCCARGRRGRRLFAATCGLLLALAVAPPATAQAQAPLSLEAVGAGELLYRGEDGLLPLPLAGIDVDLSVTGTMIRGRLTQRFHNPTAGVIEALYVFPLPDRAAVHSMEMLIGERRIVSRIQEKQRARRTYADAKTAGKKTALVEQKRPNLFTTAAANINPGEAVTVVLEYFEEARYESGRFGLRFPLTYTPRFAPQDLPVGAIGESDPRSSEPHGVEVAPRAAVSVHLRPGFELKRVESDSHRIDVTEDVTGSTVRPAAGAVVADRDFLLEWEPALGAEPRSSVVIEERQGERYALITLLPPLPGSQAGLGLPTETLFIVDVSGSMAGPSIRQAQEALLASLARLRPEDRFNLLRFNQNHVSFRSEFQQAEGQALQAAREWVADLQADGGTMIYPALLRGLGMMGDSTSSHAQRIVFLTDGAIGNEQEILRGIVERLGAVRLHTLGIGQAPNSYLLRKMAYFGHGLCEFIAAGSRTDNRIAEFFERLDRPVLRDVALEWDGFELDEIQPRRLPDLHAGEPLVVSARVRGGEGSVTIGGYTRAGWIDASAQAVDGGDKTGIGLRWARAKVETLMDTLYEGADAAAVRNAVIELALAHHLVTRFTSLVAVEETPTALGDSHALRLDAALPIGGTGRRLRLSIGLLLAFVGGAVTIGLLGRQT